MSAADEARDAADREAHAVLAALHDFDDAEAFARGLALIGHLRTLEEAHRADSLNP